MTLTDLTRKTMDPSNLYDLICSNRLNELQSACPDDLSDQQIADAKIILWHPELFDTVHLNQACRLLPSEINDIWSSGSARIVLEHLNEVGKVPLDVLENFNNRGDTDANFFMRQFLLAYKNIFDPTERTRYTDFFDRYVQDSNKREIAVQCLRQDQFSVSADMLQHDLLMTDKLNTCMDSSSFASNLFIGA